MALFISLARQQLDVPAMDCLNSHTKVVSGDVREENWQLDGTCDTISTSYKQLARRSQIV